jgi:bacterioferritin-associated ferredoxin
MNLDDKICYCFHVTRRKLVSYCKLQKPSVPSRLSECGGAGTGCGWCIPFLMKIHSQVMHGDVAPDLEELSPETYAAKRAEYVRASGKLLPPGATPIGEPPSARIA